MNETKEVDVTKKKKSKIVSVIIIIFAIILIIGIAASSANNSDNQDKIFSVGEVAINSDGVSFTITNVENTKSLGSGLLADTTTSNFILIDITIKNTSNKQITIYGGCADLYNSQNIKYEDYSSLNIDNILSEDINVGVSKNFQIAFETPTTTEQEEYILKIGYSIYTSDSNRVSIKLDKTNLTNNNNTTTNILENHSIGEMFSFDEMEITVNNYEIVSGYLFHNYEAKDNCKLVAVYVNIYNSSDNTKNLDSNYLETLYANSTTRYNTKWWSGGIYSEKFIKNHSHIIAKDTLDGVYVFEIPDTIANSSKLEFRFTFNQISKQDKIINVNLRDNQLII